MIDASHGNSMKQHSRQLLVVDDVRSPAITPSPFFFPKAHLGSHQMAQQMESGETSHSIMGVMIESFLVQGACPDSVLANGPVR